MRGGCGSEIGGGMGVGKEGGGGSSWRDIFGLIGGVETGSGMMRDGG